MTNKWWLALPLAAALAACATKPEDSFSDSKLGYAPYAAAENADQANPEAVTVTLRDYEFEPNHLSFESGRAYRLDIENKGGSTHFFAAEEFFKAVVVEKLIENGVATEHPLLRSVALAPGETKELLIVPVRQGTYELLCTAPFHRALGMSGDIVIS